MSTYYLQHHGVKGMKWGKRKDKYRSTSLQAARARRANEKVDKSFNDWKENDAKKANAIDLGKKATAAKRAYENDKSNKELKTAYKTANKEYKKALGENTTYRKGVVRKEVGQDAARKYLSEAKKVKKQLDADPSNKTLQKKYNDLMSKHDIERARARRAGEVGERRSRKKASIKRSLTVTATAVAGTAAAAAGAYAVNRYLSAHNVTVNGKRVSIGADGIQKAAEAAKKVKEALGFLY